MSYSDIASSVWVAEDQDRTSYHHAMLRLAAPMLLLAVFLSPYVVWRVVPPYLFTLSDALFCIAGILLLAGRGIDASRVRISHSAHVIMPYHVALDRAMEARLAEFERHMGDAHFCWIGGTGEDSPFYYRIQSPVTFIEFDHHAGVFLTNPEPAKFHVHTIVRTPNGNDYGFDLLRQHYKTAPHHQQAQQQQAKHHGHDHGHHHHDHGHHHHRHGGHSHHHGDGDHHHHHDHDHPHGHGHHHDDEK